MKFSQALFHEKTLPTVKTSTTFNAPGNYIPPYGKTTVKVGGRGATGNPNTPGNYVAGNYVAGNIVSYNPWSYYVTTDVFYVTGFPSGGHSPGKPPGHYTGYPYNVSYSNPQSPFTYQCYSAFYSCGYTVYISITNTYNGGGNANYNPSTSNPSYSNPTVPGNSGPSYSIACISFPGGAAASLAPVVSPTPTNLAYTGSCISITVPCGGYVVVCNS